MQKQLMILLAGLSALLGACANKKPNEVKKRVLPVFASAVEKQDVPIYIYAVGNVYSPFVVDIRPQVGGRLVESFVADGQMVKSGQILYLIDETPFKAALDRANAALQKDTAALEFAKKKLERYSSLVTQDYVSKLNYDQYTSDVGVLEGQVLSDKADIDLAKINLDYCSIRSPIDGKISLNNIHPGNILYPTNITSISTTATTTNTSNAIPLTTVRQLSPIQIRFSLSQEDFQRVKLLGLEKASFAVFLPAQEEPIDEGRVNFVDNTLDLTTGTILLKGNSPNRGLSLWPGEYVDVRLLVETVSGASVIPFSALQYGQKGEFVYVVKADGTVEARQVKTLTKIGQSLAIERGLSENEMVVTEGQVNLYPGATVAIKTKTREKK